MTTLMLAFMMQYVVATKAGLVNHVQGLANVSATKMVEAMIPVRTGPNGLVELLLTPGSYLRMGPNSEAVLESVDLSGVAVRLVSGQAIVEVVEISSEYPVKFTTGQTTVELTDPGIFTFKDGLASVLEGKFRTAVEPKVSYKKGWEVSYSTNYRARKLPDLKVEAALLALSSYSQQRSALMARANADLAPVVMRSNYNSMNPYWLYSPMLGALTYMPIRNIRSPYGFPYLGIGIVYANNGRFNSNGVATGSNNATSGSSNSGSSSSSSGGTFNSGGERTFSPPAGERVTAPEYQNQKAPSAPVTAPPPPPGN